MERISILPTKGSQSVASYYGAKVRSSLLECYPRLKKYRKLLPEAVYFGKLSEIKEVEREDISIDELPVYQAISKLLPEAVVSFLDESYYSVRTVGQAYANPSKGTILLPEGLRQALNKDHPEAVIDYSSYLLENMIRGLAYRVNPQRLNEVAAFFFRLMMSRDCGEFINIISEKLESKKVFKFQTEVRRYFSDTFSLEGFCKDQAYLCCVGAKVVYLREGQPISRTEFSLGGTLDLGTVLILADPVKRVLFKDSGQVHPSQIEAEKVFSVMGLRGESLLESYIHSKIPQLYMEWDDYRLNPFCYGEVS